MLLGFILSLGPDRLAGQTVLPEQQISSMQTLVQGYPDLSASRSRVFANWLSYIEAPRIGVGYAQSVDRGTSWINQVGFPIADQDESVSQPSASCLDLLGRTHFAAGGGAVQYFRGAGFSPTVWAPPAICLANMLKRSHYVTGMACEAGGGVVYAASTEASFDLLTDLSSVVLSRSLDGGIIWDPPSYPSSGTSLGQSMVVVTDGTLYVSFVDIASGHLLVRRSSDRGTTFGAPVVAATMRDNLGTRPFGWNRRYNIEGDFIYPSYRKVNLAPNFPALAVDGSSGPTRGNLYLVWSEYPEGTISPATVTLGSGSGNNSFATALLAPLDSDVSGSMPDIHVSSTARYIAFDGAAGQTVWIDGTASPNQHSYYLFWEMPNGSRPFAYAAYLTSPDPAFGRTAPIILTLPYTGRYYLRLDPPNGSSLSFQFRLRTYEPSATSVSRDMRDIVLVRSTDGGQTWSGKVRVNHDPPGADQHQPNVAVDDHGNVYVAWYDRRGIPAGDSVHAYAAVSVDGGLSFGSDLKLSSRPSGWSGVAEPQFELFPGELIGDRIAIAAGDNYGLVAWADLRNWPARSDVYAARIVDVPTAVAAVSDFAAVAMAEGVSLSWHLNDPRGITGMRIHRSESGGPESPVSDEIPATAQAARLEFLDTSAEPGRSYSYRLQIRSGTQVAWLGPVAVDTPQRISSLAWRAAWPNPFGRSTSITLAVPRPADGAVRVYDVQGKEVRTLAEGRFEPGERTLQWDGRDAAGNATAPGIYFLSAQVGDEQARLRLARVQ